MSSAADRHERIGQALTALRVNAAVLLRKAAGQPELQAAAREVERQGAAIDRALRALLGPLPPERPTLRAPLHDWLEKWHDAAGAPGRLDVQPPDLRLSPGLSQTLSRMTHDALALATRPLFVSVKIADDDPAVLCWSATEDGTGLRLAARLPLGAGDRR